MKSIYFAARQEELKFLEKQVRNSECFESNKLEKNILSDWNRFAFWLWLGGRIREHFRGEKCWFELSQENFGKAKENSEISEILLETEKIENALESSNLINFKDKQDLLARWQKLCNKLF